MAYEEPLTIAEVMQDIQSNRYVLPSIQREYVWKPDQIEMLFDSLMRDYPIGTFLFWEVKGSGLLNYNFYEFLKDYREDKDVHNDKIDLRGSNGVIAVLDGQQRLTSLYIGLKGSYAYRLKHHRRNNENAYPPRRLYLNLIEGKQDEDEPGGYDFRFMTSEEFQGMKKGYWYEVGNILTMTQSDEARQYVDENIVPIENSSGEKKYTKEQTDHATNTLEKLFCVVNTDKTLSYYKEKATELDKVLNIFVRINSGGTKLSYSDLLLSIASAQWENIDAREEIITFVDEINSIGGGFKIDKDFVLKAALVLTDINSIVFKVDNFNKANTMKIERNWENVKHAIRRAVSLVSSFGYTGETLSSNNALIPIAYYLLTIGMPDNFEQSSMYRENREKIKKWLIQVLLKKTFSGQSDQVISSLRKIIQKNGKNDFPIAQIVDQFRGQSKSIQFTEDDIDDFLLNLKYGKSDTLSTLMLLYPSFDYSNRIFHVDHIYPKSKFTKSYLREKKVPEDKLDACIKSVNSIGNLQLLAGQLNEEKLDKDFEDWFGGLSSREQDSYRVDSYLPEMEYTYPNFLQFIDERKRLLRKRLIEILL